MNTKRLARLREVLMNIPKERFDIHRWVCGTTACAVGWGCTDPKLQKEGLRLTNLTAGVPKFNHFVGWDAVKAFFQIDDYTADYLFNGDCYVMAGRPGPRDVVERIDEVLENGEHYTSLAALREKGAL